MNTSNNVFLPQGAIVNNTIVVLATIIPSTGGQVYVYAQDNGSGSFQLWNPSAMNNPVPIQFRVHVTTEYITLTSINPAGVIVYDANGNVMIAAMPGQFTPLALPIFLNQTNFTGLEPNVSVIASVLYMHTGAPPNIQETIALKYPVENMGSVSHAALVPVTIYSRNNGCQTTSNPAVSLNLFARSHLGVSVPPGTPTTAWTTAAACNTNVTFELCNAGTYCSGNCFSICPQSGQVCTRQNGMYRCTSPTTVTPPPPVTDCPTMTTPCPKTTTHHHHHNNTTTTTNSSIPQDIFVHHTLTGSVPPLTGDQPASTWWIWIIFAIVILLVIGAVLYFMFWSGTSHVSDAYIYDHHHHNYITG